MSKHREQLGEIAEIFVNLPPEGQVELLNRLGDSGAPPEWLDLMARHIMRTRTDE
jgi:hypothetical protein